MRSFSCITPLLLASALMSMQVSSTNADVQEHEYKTQIIQRKKRIRSLQETRSPSTKAPGPSTKAPGPSTKAPGPSIECAPESANGQFFLKRTNGNYGPAVFQTCAWLSTLSERHVRHICSRKKSCDDKGPAREVCPETCDSCPKCHEDAEASFFLEKRGPHPAVYKSCKWLNRQHPRDIKAICRSDISFDGVGPAKDACPATCETCPDPSAPSAAPSTPIPTLCPEDEDQEFFLEKRGPNPVFKSCGWLSQLHDWHIHNICRRKFSFGDVGPAGDVCPATCDKCPDASAPSAAPSTTTPELCSEDASSEFFLKKRGRNAPAMYQTCEWLGRQRKKHIHKICKNKWAFSGVGPAREICPSTCNTCPE